MKEFYYIYNYEQANFLLQKGIIPVEFGKSNKGFMYLKFEKCEKTERVMNIWMGKSSKMGKCI